MRAVLSDLGIIDFRNDMLTISVIRGTNSAMHSFRSQVGQGSSSHDLTGDCLIIFHISVSVVSIGKSKHQAYSGTPEKRLSPNHLYVYLSILFRSLCSIHCCRRRR